MSEATETVAAPAAPQALTVAQAAQMHADQRAAKQTAQATNPSDAARILNQAKAAKALQRTTEAAQAIQEPAVEAEGSEPEDESQLSGTPGDETAKAEPSTETETAEESEPAEQTIELEPGLKVTLGEVRDGFMLKADHTRKTQALAEKSKEIEAKFSQTMTQLEKVIASLEPATGDGKPKTRRDFIQEYGVEDGLDKYEDHLRKVNAAKQLASQVRSKAQQEARTKAEQECDQYLVENHNKEWADQSKYEAAQVEITKYAKSLGFSSEQIYALGVIPGALIALDKARQLDALKAKQGEVTRTIADKPKVIKPGAKVSAQAGVQSNLQAAQSRLKSSGSLKDAVAFLQAQRKSR